ncbi:MAG: PAS domain-containing protein, partial [Candidatus Thermoplasmatota archaeon]
VEYNLVRRDGSRFLGQLSTNVFNDSSDNPIGFVATTKDITMQKKTEEKIKTSKQEKENILNAAADGLRVVGKDFKVKNLNETMAEMAGVSIDEAVGMKCNDMFWSEKLCGTNDCSMKKVLESGEKLVRESMRKNKKGEKIPCLSVASPYRDSSGKVVGIVEDFRDISDIKQTRDELQEKLNALERYKEATVGREMRVVELKKEINELCKSNGLPARYNDIEYKLKKDNEI